MNPEITSIPNLLVKHYGNIEAVSRELDVHWYTVRKHAKDIEMKNHVVVNGRFMSERSRKREVV